MSALTVRLADDKHQRLRVLARSRGTTINHLIDEIASVMLAESDTETRFLACAQAGEDKTERGLDLLRTALG